MASVNFTEGVYEDVRNATEHCEKLVENVVQGRSSLEVFGDALRQTGITVVLSRQDASTADHPNKDGPCC